MPRRRDSLCRPSVDNKLSPGPLRDTGLASCIQSRVIRKKHGIGTIKKPLERLPGRILPRYALGN